MILLGFSVRGRVRDIYDAFISEFAVCVICLIRGKNDLKLPLIYIAFALQASVYRNFERLKVEAPERPDPFLSIFPNLC